MVGVGITMKTIAIGRSTTMRTSITMTILKLMATTTTMKMVTDVTLSVSDVVVGYWWMTAKR